MTGQPRRRLDAGAVGVYASTANHARSLAQDLNIPKPVCFGPKSLNTVRGTQLKVLLVAEDCWPLPPHTMAEVAPALQYHLGYVYVISRHDPRHLPTALLTGELVHV